MFEEQIERGVEFLDKNKGTEWIEEIDPSELSMGNSCNCVIGQLYGDFEEIYNVDVNVEEDDTVDMGFMLDLFGDYDTLTEEWQEKIAQLRAERSI